MAWAVARAGTGDEAGQARERLAGFRRELYRCFTARADALSELCDAALCRAGPGAYAGGIVAGARASARPWRLVRRAELRESAGLAAALGTGRVGLRAWDDGRIRLAVDVSNWLRPDAATSPGRSFCHCYGRGNNSAQMIRAGRTRW